MNAVTGVCVVIISTKQADGSRYAQSCAMPVEPLSLISNTVSTVWTIYKMCKTVKENREETKRFCRHANSLLETIQSRCADKKIPKKLFKSLSTLHKFVFLFVGILSETLIPDYQVHRRYPGYRERSLKDVIRAADHLLRQFIAANSCSIQRDA